MKKTILYFITLFVIILVVTHPVTSQVISDDNVKNFAQKSLQTYIKDVINGKNYTRFGFKHLEETTYARLGTPYKVYYIGLDKLKNYTSGQNLDNFILDASKFWFPVIVGDSTRLKLEVINMDGKLIAGDFGSAHFSRIISQVGINLSNILKSEGIDNVNQVSLLKIPALRITLFHIKNSEGDYFIPVADAPQYNLIKEEVYKADEIFNVLKQYAAKIDPNVIR